MNKRWLLLAAAVLSITGGVFLLFPETAPLGPVVKSIGDEVRAEANRQLDDCPDSWCARDAKGECHLCGPVSPRDGGRACVCR